MALFIPLLLLAAVAAHAAPAGTQPTQLPAEQGPLGQLPPMRFPEGPSREKLIGREGPRLTQTGASSAASVPVFRASTAPASLPTLPVRTSNLAPNATVTIPEGAAGAAERQPFVEPTKSAGILVGVFVGVALLGYAALLVWRRVLEKRYGNREILVNEEQFEQERDLSNFQL